MLATLLSSTAPARASGYPLQPCVQSTVHWSLIIAHRSLFTVRCSLCTVPAAGDWLQGPYVYALYQHYGYKQADIGRLFIAGFGSSMIFGTIVGSLADKRYSTVHHLKYSTPPVPSRGLYHGRTLTVQVVQCLPGNWIAQYKGVQGSLWERTLQPQCKRHSRSLQRERRAVAQQERREGCTGRTVQ